MGTICCTLDGSRGKYKIVYSVQHIVLEIQYVVLYLKGMGEDGLTIHLCIRMNTLMYHDTLVSQDRDGSWTFIPVNL